MSVVFSEMLRAWRAMLRRPGYFVLATGVLALGIAATAGVGTLVYAVLLRPLPYPQPRQLVSLGGENMGVAYRASPMDYQHMLPLPGVQSLGLEANGAVSKNIATGGEPELVQATQVDHGLLSTLGVRLAAGRNFTAAEDSPNGPRAVILSHGFWMRRYGGDPHVLGRQMSVEGRSSTVVGVLPAGADIQQASLLLPLALAPNSTDDGENFRAIARVAPGVSLTRLGSVLQVRMRTMHARVGGPFADYFAHEHYRADKLQTVLHVNARPVLLMFLASALALLLIALVNLANLVLLRSLSRAHDEAVRHALGAPWLRRMLPVLAEASLIGMAAVVTGGALAVVGLRLLGGLIPASWVGGAGLPLSGPVAGSAVAMGLLGVAMAVGLGLWRGRAVSSAGELREGGRSGMSRSSGRLGRILVVAQVALATTLLCTGGLFLHALYDAAHSRLGFTSKGVLTFELSPMNARYPDAAAVRSLTRQLVARLGAIPGVEQVSVGTGLPAGARSQSFYLGNIHRPGEPPGHNAPQIRAVDPAFFPAFGISMREGRSFGAGDRAGSEPVAIINRALAQRMYGGHALGQTIDYTAPLPGGRGQAMSLRIVGVMGTISPFGPLGNRDSILYVPLAQMPDGLLELYRSANPLYFALHVHGDPLHFRAALTAALAAVAPGQPLARLRSMQQVVHETSDAARLNLLLVGLFAGLAVLLAAVGLYAVVAMSAASREREFGVRLALGASPAGMMKIVLRGGLVQVLLGVTIGLGLALGLSGTLHAVLTQINRSAFDPLVMATVALVLMVVGLLSCAIPALRAGRVLPMRALRGE